AARLYGVDPEMALARTNQKFTQRFNYLEEETLMKGKNLHDMSLEEMDVIWEKAKSVGREQ
ncbi:MAG: nucleoside triphosphate pyrophosphohydrolase, partial [Bacteroidales bacterium]|nr:nucleoside triphosphate pyrophosphohydrolase [Bacteroidales bacterium]